MKKSTVVIILLAVSALGLVGCAGQAARVFTPIGGTDQVITESISIGDYKLVGSDMVSPISEEDRLAADEVAKSFIARLASDISSLGIKLSPSGKGQTVISSRIHYIKTWVPLTARQELFVVLELKKSGVPVLSVTKGLRWGPLIPTSYFVDGVSKQITEKLKESVTISTP